ncbi:MAG: hypothetical protein V4555_05080 [Acidobacteriota bacterium]
MLQPPDQPASSLHSEECREELRKILSSKTFQKSPRLASLLEYIFGYSLTGDLDELTEQQIGIHFFHRPPGYNAGEDTIVRGTARHLRKRLEQYYKDEGGASLFRLTIPKGAYVAHFGPYIDSDQTSSSSEISETDRATPANGFLSAITAGWKLKLVMAFLFGAGLSAGLLYHVRTTPATEVRGPEILWRALFAPGRKTFLVPGDAALNMYTDVEHRDVQLREYTLQSYQSDTSFAPIPVAGRSPVSLLAVTPISDLRLIAELAQIPYTLSLKTPLRPEVRYARELSFPDIHGNNLILIGPDSFDPWISLFKSTQDFQLRREFSDYSFVVENKAPRQGEKSIYTWSAAKTDKDAITLVALTDNTQGGGKVLLIQGTTMGSTYGALNFLFDDEAWKPVMAKATDKNGQLHNFEVMLFSDLIRGGVSNTRVMAVHIH